MNSETNKRISPRSIVEIAAFVYVMEEWVACKTIDLSLEAISVELVYPLIQGGLVALDFHQTQGMKKHEMLTEILRCDALETDPVTHRVVMKFVDPSQDFMEDTKALIQSEP
ncbi:MAG: PilZ domain-containing protein [Nitrospina sp.]|jgi:hypothetical protein|nr:PilZ domain-containing protein [Nitrospina sp.]